MTTITSPRELPCGAWPSPLSPELAAAGAVSLAHAGASEGVLYWVEGRPSERGRSVLMSRAVSGAIAEVLGPEANVRSRVHEYGGLPWARVGERLVASQFDDQSLRLRASDGSTTVLTPPGCRYADGVGAPDGHTLVCVREDHRAAGEPVNAVVAIDCSAPGDAGRVLYGDSDFVAWPRLSADGRRLALVAWDHPAMPWDATRLLVAELLDGVPVAWQGVAGGPGESVLEPQWDADGTLYFLSDRSGWWNLHRWHDGQVEAVTALDAEVGGPIWQLGMRSYALTGDGHALLRINRHASEMLVVLDLASGAMRQLRLPFAEFGAPGLLDANTGFAIAVAVDQPPALITFDLRPGHEGAAYTVVRSAGAAPLPPEAVSRAQAIQFPTAAGPDGQARTAHAWFYPPRLPGVAPQDGEVPPLLVLLHGGPTSCAGRGFRVGVQFWTTRGFAVVDVNYGGSSGYGRAYRERLRGQWGVVDLQDAVAAVDFLAATGQVDGRRVAIRGGSAGGFTVLSALAFTTRFAAGINYYGVADLETLAQDTHKFESRYLDGLVAPLPAGREVYRARSPVHHMAACRAALITFQGSDDRAVPPQQSRAIVDAARAAGCPVAYLEFEGEGHGFRQGPNIVRALQAELAFLGRVFGFMPADALPPLAIDNDATIGSPQPAAS
jgi:dipeptidyl aminopeptidase/acylaminoacyl peptidase